MESGNVPPPGPHKSCGPTVVGISRLAHEQRVARCGRVVYEPLAIARPIELASLPQIRPQWPAASRHGKIFTSPGCEPSARLVPDCNERRVRREAERTDQRIDEVGYVAMRQSCGKCRWLTCVTQSIDLPVPVRQKCHEFPVARDCRRLLSPGEVRQANEFGVGKRIAPGVNRFRREPGQRACDQHDRGRKYQHEPGWPGTPCSRARSSLGAWHDSDGSLNFTRAFLCESRAPTLPPGVELRAECKNGSLLIVPMAMNRHRLAPFPPLYGTDVALQI